MRVAPLSAPKSQPVQPPTPGGDLVAFGDSVAFGYDPRLPKSQPDAFVAYSDVVGRDEGLKVDNFAQPGETSASLSDKYARNNGGWIPDPGNPTQRIHDRPLHESYNVNQLDAGIDFLKKTPDTKLVTLNIGGNDMLLLQKDSQKGPLPVWLNELLGLPKTLINLYQNLTHSLQKLRAAYQGPIVVTNQYQLDYGDAISTLGIDLENWVISMAVKTVDLPGSPAKVADVDAAFKKIVEADPAAHGSTGAAGLLVPFERDGQPYDIHPSAEGRDVLAHSVEQTQQAIEASSHATSDWFAQAA